MSESLEQKMCHRSRGYDFVLSVFVRPAFYLFYRRVNVIGAKSIPDKGPVIFTPNHQNALMDALAVLCTKDRQPVFLARADIFQNPIIIKILHFLRILPIFRKRDGGNSVDHNQETFDIIQSVLDHGQAVGIMPEGTHSEIKHLRMLQKGVFRLAMQVQEKHENQPAVKIIPVGLEYSSTSKFRSDITVNYGKAMEMSDYYNLYIENQARAFKVMQDTLSEKMKEGMVDIRNKPFYSEIERVRVFYEKQAVQRLGLNYRKAEDRLHAQQKIIAGMQELSVINTEAMAGLCSQVREYVSILEKYRFHDRIVEQQPCPFTNILGKTLLAALGIPFWLLGVLFNYLPYKVSVLGSRKVKDPQFISSVRFVLGLVLYPVYHSILTVFSLIFIPCLWGKIVMISMLIPSGIFAFHFCLHLNNLHAHYRFRINKRRRNEEILKTVELRKNIFAAMNQIIKPDYVVLA